MKISIVGINLIKSFEGMRLTAYRDAAGVWTIGWGSTRYADGKPVKNGDKLLNRECADDLFMHTLQPYEDAVANGVKVRLSQNQFDALVSLTYNVGTGVMYGSTLVRKLNAGDYLGAAEQFLVWNKITDPATNTKVACDTLTLRRKKEKNYFLKP